MISKIVVGANILLAVSEISSFRHDLREAAFNER